MALIQTYNFTTETNFPPIFEGEYPAYGSNNVPLNTNVSITVADPNNNINPTLLYVEYTNDFIGPIYDYIPIYDYFSGGFQSGFTSSTLNFISGGSTDGYDAYVFNIIPDNEYLANSLIEFGFYATDYEGEEWDYDLQFTTESGWAPFLGNVSPNDLTTGVSINSNISFKVFNTTATLKPEYIASSISFNSGLDWTLMYDGDFGGFQAGFNGVSSSINPISEDGYDGYLITIDPENPFDYDAYIICNIDVFNPSVD